MTRDSISRQQWVQELENIRQQLSRLSDGSDDAVAVRNELAVLALRIKYLATAIRNYEKSASETSDARVILVVDDNEELRTFIKQALELTDYHVLDAQDGSEALALLRDTARVDLVLCDVILPGMKGPDLIKEIRKSIPDVKVIFMSGYIAEDIVSQDVEQIVVSGGKLLQKPFPTRKMLETIHDTLGC